MISKTITSTSMLAALAAFPSQAVQAQDMFTEKGIDPTSNAYDSPYCGSFWAAPSVDPSTVEVTTFDASATANAAYLKGDMEATIQLATQVLSTENDYDSYLLRAYAHFGSDNYVESIKDIDTCLRLQPDNAAAFVFKGDVLNSLELYDLATYWYSRSLEVGGIDPTTLCNRGRAYYSRHKMEEAIADYTLALEISDDPMLNMTLLKSRAACYLEMDMSMLAYNDILTSLYQSPDDADLYFLMGKVEMMDGKFGAASRSFQVAVDLDRSNYDYQYQLSVAMLANQDFGGAMTMIETTQFQFPQQKELQYLWMDAQNGLRALKAASVEQLVEPQVESTN